MHRVDFASAGVWPTATTALRRRLKAFARNLMHVFSYACAAYAINLTSDAWGEDQGARKSEREISKTMLRQVDRWGCQYLNIRPSDIAQSDLDMIIIEMTIDGAEKTNVTPEQVASMQRKPDGGRRLVLAYLSVGEAADYRSYWQPEWDEGLPEWIGAENPNWPQAYSVHFWQSGWRRILFGEPSSLLDTILALGFDGAFLDRVDAYSDWSHERPDSALDMVSLVDQLATYARRANPAFLLVGQNAEGLLQHKAYRDAIDAVSKESLLFGRAGEEKPNTPEQIHWGLKYLGDATAAGLPVFVIEYLSIDANIESAGKALHDLGFIPFFGQRLLDRLPE